MVAVAAAGEHRSPEAGQATRRLRHRRVVAVIQLGDGPLAAATVGLDGSRYELYNVRIDRRTIARLRMLGPDIVIIDTVGDAADLARFAAAVRSAMDTRVVIVSDAPVSDEQIVSALDAGADDVVVRPSADVLHARLRVALRGHSESEPAPSIIRVGDVTMDLDAHDVRIDGDGVRCPPVQYELLRVLASNPGTTITVAALLRAGWGVQPGDVHPRRLRIAISTTRRILGSGPQRPEIHAVTKVGYRLSVPVGT